MEKTNLEISNPEGIYDPRSHGYSHVASVSANSSLVFVAGQGGSRTDGVLSDDFRTQVSTVFENIALALKSKNLGMANIAKLTTLVVDYDEAKHEILIEESNKIWADQKFPVNTLIPVQRLALSGMLIEIDATAIG
ncbi:hypothetical protein ASU31_10045 [Pedobacter ginsenosidimutans]|uniref:Enamine deaminase RidA n=1 Tax=Pedobacter ginsenosidimutans TaxID=687842 RepID=A0A0T5VRW2_9SPHI|nr:RidA family protein [Pedobacter ginsenosidimutans]KRT16495.1 hypothetical protein ASU31_10045 [Pedobacter ginsenosidimutans]